MPFSCCTAMAEVQPPEKPETLREQGEAVVSDMRDAALHISRHLESLVELFHLELCEYGRGQARRLLALAVGSVLLVCAYLLLCLFAVVELQPHWGFMWAFLAVILFNVVAGGAALLVAALCKPAGVAPATAQEIKNDIRCIQLYLKGKAKS